MRIPNATHTSHPWRIAEIAPDFRLEDVWDLPTPGGADDFGQLVTAVAGWDPEHDAPWIVKMLFLVRWHLGNLLGWDDTAEGTGGRVTTLRDRLPADLHAGPPGPDFAELPFTSLYLLDDEWAAESANETMHGILHLSWVPDGGGRYHGRLAIYVKPNGWFGEAYMVGIKPFRYTLVYPLMLQQIGRQWREQATR